MVYFDDIEAKEICPSFHAYRTHAVANHKPAPIVVYDYYDTCKYFNYVDFVQVTN